MQDRLIGAPGACVPGGHPLEFKPAIPAGAGVPQHRRLPGGAGRHDVRSVSMDKLGHCGRPRVGAFKYTGTCLRWSSFDVTVEHLGLTWHY